MVELYGATYEMELGGGYDLWRLTGDTFGHPGGDGKKFPSAPVEFNEATDILKTISGRVYKIMSYINRDKVVGQIKSDITNGGYERH